VFNQLADTDSAQHSKVSAPVGDTEESFRHLSHEDLKAYTDGRLTETRLNDCRAHLDACEDCRAELEDLRTWKSDLSAFPRPTLSGPTVESRKRRRGLALIYPASLAVISAAAIVVASLMWGRGGTRANRTSATLPAHSVQANDTRLAAAIATPSGDHKSVTATEIQHGTAQPATDVNRSRARAPNSPGAPEANTGFSLLGPFGETISETRPEFRWQPMVGAIRYSVRIVDAGLRPVQRSPSLRTTAWRPRRPLRPGRTYLWQVTATLRGGKKVVASSPSAAEALLRIAPT
jgi:anti-sigma factor RsiW